MDIKQLDAKEKMIIFFGEVKSNNVETAIKDITKINLQDDTYVMQCQQWAKENRMPESPVRRTPITFYLSTGGGSCYDGLALFDVIESSATPVEIICVGKIMSMGIIITLASKVRKAHKNTTFMIHQVSGFCWGELKEMEESVEETRRINDRLFSIIKAKTRITEQQLNDVVKYKKDWYLTAEEALDLGIVTEIIP